MLPLDRQFRRKCQRDLLMSAFVTGATKFWVVYCEMSCKSANQQSIITPPAVCMDHTGELDVFRYEMVQCVAISTVVGAHLHPHFVRVDINIQLSATIQLCWNFLQSILHLSIWMICPGPAILSLFMYSSSTDIILHDSSWTNSPLFSYISHWNSVTVCSDEYLWAKLWVMGSTWVGGILAPSNQVPFLTVWVILSYPLLQQNSW